MSTFWTALITAGGDAEAIAAVMDEHHRFVAAREAEGKILASGPFRTDSPGPVGMIVLATSDLAEAKALMNAEPLIARGLRTYDLRPWEIREGTLSEGFSRAAGETGSSAGGGPSATSA